MGAPSIDLAPELNALPEPLRYAALIAVNKAITSSTDRFLLEYFQERNPELFGTVLPRAIAAGLKVLGRFEPWKEILAQVRQEAETERILASLARVETPGSIAVAWAVLSARRFGLLPEESALLTQLLLHAFADPELLTSMLSNDRDESSWLSDEQLAALGAKRPATGT